MAGLVLDPWEAWVLEQSLGERDDGQWAALEVAGIVPRQNGKGSILEAREIAGLFLLEERLIVHSAHEFSTSLEHFRRIKDLVEGTPEFSRRVKKNGIKNSHGEEGIELSNGQRIRFRTRTKGGLRGFTGDLIVFDEAMDLPEAAHGAMFPTLAAKSILGNPQIIYMASAVDQWIHENGLVLARLRERGLKGGDPALAFFEWSADCDNPEQAAAIATDPEVWAEANPGLGIRISAEHIEREQVSMSPRNFAVERLCVGDWPRTDGEEEQVISPEVFGSCIDAESTVKDPVCFSPDVTPDRSFSSIGVAGARDDGLGHIEVVERKRGTHWVIPRLLELVQAHETREVILDGSGPAASLLADLEPELEKLGIELRIVTATEHAKACGALYDAFQHGSLRHLGTPELSAAVRGAKKRPLGEAWAWSRKNSTVDISPLVACTLAHWAASAPAEVASAPWVSFS